MGAKGPNGHAYGKTPGSIRKWGTPSTSHVAAAWHIVSEVPDSPGNGLGRVPCGVTGMYINGIYEESHTYPHILEIYRNGILKFLGIQIDNDATHFSPCECL